MFSGRCSGEEHQVVAQAILAGFFLMAIVKINEPQKIFTKEYLMLLSVC